MFKRIVSCLFVCLCLASRVDADTILQTATFSADGSNCFFIGNSGPDRINYNAVRFQLDRVTHVTKLGFGNLSANGPLFAAIVPISGPAAFPAGNPFNDNEALGYQLFTPGGGDVSVPFDITLTPGYYMVVVGSHKFGATGDGGMCVGGTPLTTGGTQFWYNLNGGWSQVALIDYPFRYVVEGTMDAGPQYVVDSLSPVINSRASQTSVNALAATLGSMSTTLGGRASQSSVDAFSTSVAAQFASLFTSVGSKASQQSVDNLNGVVATGSQVTNLSASLGTLTTSVGALNTSVGSLSSSIEQLPHQSDLTSLATGLNHNIDTRASQASVDALASSLGTSGDLGVKLAIERALADDTPLASFFLPQSVGGHLERVHDIVGELLTAAQQAGLDVTKARAQFVRGETAHAAGEFKTAFDGFARAYQLLIK